MKTKANLTIFKFKQWSFHDDEKSGNAFRVAEDGRPLGAMSRRLAQRPSGYAEPAISVHSHEFVEPVNCLRKTNETRTYVKTSIIVNILYAFVSFKRSIQAACVSPGNVSKVDANLTFRLPVFSISSRPCKDLGRESAFSLFIHRLNLGTRRSCDSLLAVFWGSGER